MRLRGTVEAFREQWEKADHQQLSSEERFAYFMGIDEIRCIPSARK